MLMKPALALTLCLILALGACAREERRPLPQPQDGNGSVIDLRNDGYFERLNVPQKEKPSETQP